MRRITSMDVAKKANVSQSTVSFVLNNRTDIAISPETRSRVLQAARELQYGPYSTETSLSMQNNIAVFVPSLENPYYPYILTAISKELHAKKLNMILCCTDKNERKETDLLNSIDKLSVGGIIFTYTPLAKKLSVDISKRKKTIIIGEVDYNINASIVTLNSKHAGELVAEYLYSLGHKKIAYISTPMNILSISRKRRFEGICEFFERHGVKDNLVICAPENSTKNEPDIGYEETLRLFKKNKDITALIGVNDYLTLGIISALRTLNKKIPEDVSVISFDNSTENFMLEPKLTTVDHLIEQRTHYAVDLLVSDHVHYQNIIITYDPTLIIRESTAVYNK